MRILIETVGSAGDVHPFVAVGRELMRRGHELTLFANEHFRPAIEAAGLRCVASSTQQDFDEMTANGDLWHPLRGPLLVLGSAVARPLERTTDAILDENPGDETVIVAPTLGFAGRCAAELADVPFVRVHLQPTAFRSVHAAPRLPGMWMPIGAPAWCKRLSYRTSDIVIDRVVCPRLNAFRARRGLAPARRVFGDRMHEADALIALYPEWFAPPQPDHPPGAVHAGFTLFDRGEQAPTDRALDAWLRGGGRPIVFTHGSANRHGHAFFAASAAAARALGRRALLVTTEPDAVSGLTGAGVRHETYAPFGDLLPHAAAFVHHGGIGTTAQGLAAGVPQLVVPLGFDQFDNAARVTALGAGTSTTAKRYRARTAAVALRGLIGDAHAHRAACAAAERIDGAAAAAVAARAIEQAVSGRRRRALP